MAVPLAVLDSESKLVHSLRDIIFIILQTIHGAQQTSEDA